MNTYPQFELRLEPREELTHLVAITAGLLASGRFMASAKDVAQDVFREFSVSDVAGQLLGQLRAAVEANVDEHPERYTGLSNE